MIRMLGMTVAAAALFAGCGGGGSASTDKAMKSDEQAAMKKEGEAAMKGEDAAMAAGGGATVQLLSSQFGRILADGKRQAFYAFDREKSSKSRCYGACAKAWPPVLTKGKPKAGPGARKSLLGTTKRRDGKLQVTYNGRPLYYYSGDSPGKVLCQNVREFGGLWLVVKPNGSPVT
jgi:predicted lipoprotein with Yx(FWY)xxD motif